MHINQVRGIDIVYMGQENLPKTPELAYDFPKTHNIDALHQIFDTDPNSHQIESLGIVGIAGRIVSTRDMGKICFTTIADHTGSIQLISENDATEGYETLQATQNNIFVAKIELQFIPVNWLIA